MMMNRSGACLAVALLLGLWLGGCGGQPEKAGEPDVVQITFWHTQGDKNGQVLRAIVDEFNRTHPTIHVKDSYVAGYDMIFRKLKTATLAGELPDLAVAYESMVAEYMRSGVVQPLDPYLADPEIGLSQDSINDIYPAFLQTNRFPQYDNQLLSFPFTKSLLILYYNVSMLKDAGFDHPAKTWAEFIDQCRAIRRLIGRPAYALSVDASTIHAMIMSFGGRIVDSATLKTGYDSPAGVQALKVIDQLMREKLADSIKYRSYNDRVDLANGRCAFMIRSSTSRPYLAELIGDKFPWDMAIIPHGKGQEPVTVLFGANICMFKSTAQRQRAAWQFIKYFCSPEVTARWASQTGYMPVRKSAAETDTMKAFFAERPQNRRTIEILPFARSEANLSGMQAVRELVEEAEKNMIFAKMSPEKAAKELAAAAEKRLREKR